MTRHLASASVAALALMGGLAACTPSTPTPDASTSTPAASSSSTPAPTETDSATAPADTSPLEQQLRALADGKPHQLPQHLGDVQSWQTGLIVCPYTPLSDIDEPFRTALTKAGVNPEITDSEHWLALRDGDNVTVLHVSPSQVNLCTVSGATPVAADTTFVFSEITPDDPVMVAPVS